MTFADERREFEAELGAFYSRYPADVSAVARRLDAENARHPSWSPCRRKISIYQALAADCPVHVFRHFPFFFQFDTGKARTDLGTGGVGGWLKEQPFGKQLQAEGGAWWNLCWETGLSLGWPVLDDNHHCMGPDNFLRHGVNGLLVKVEGRRAAARTDKECDLLDAMDAGLRVLLTTAGRFAAEAGRLAVAERDPMIRARLQRMEEAARRIPAEPPSTFFEAANMILFMREVTQALESSGISILGHLDRLLWPYYERDLAAGRITREEAKDLLGFLLALSDTRFGIRDVAWHYGTNTTVMIGGCDAAGSVVFNDLTRMIVELYEELRLVDPKLNARISRGHPVEYFDLLGRLIAAGGNSLCVFNDDVLIPANAKMGKAVEDCRLYVGGGCQENVLENTEVNSRATIYLNLLQVFLMGFFPEPWTVFTGREGIRLKLYEGCGTFDALVEVFLFNLKAVVDAHVAQRNRTEKESGRFNPCPLHSTLLSDCIEKAQDMMEGGARYSFGSVSLAGIGTLVDSLYAVRMVVFEEKRVTLAQLRAMLANDFAGEEKFRQHLSRRVPKFGQEDAAIREFSAKVFADVARVSSGQPNTRGGRYEASLFAFRSFADLGVKTGATPDGRKAGWHVSQGMAPSGISLGQKCSVGQVLAALEPLDLTLYPVVAVLDVKLPLAASKLKPRVLTPVLKRFVESGGSVLQLNCVDPALLLEAKAHPERHQDLVVRISGFSALFRTLPEPIQDEVIQRTLTTA